MVKQKLKIYLTICILILLISFLGFLYFLNKENINDSNDKVVIKKNLSTKLNANNFKTLQDYLTTIDGKCGTGISLLNEPFFIKLNNVYSKINVNKFDNSNKELKNLTILKVDEACRNNQIFNISSQGKSGIESIDPTSISKDTTSFVNLIEKSQINKDWIKNKKLLETKNNLNSQEIKELSFIYDVEGNYKFKQNLCKKYNSCLNTVNVTISGTTKDQQGNILTGVNIYFLGDSLINVKSDNDGKYNLILKINELSSLKVRAIKNGYSDSFFTNYISFESNNFLFNHDFILTKAQGIVNFTKFDFESGKLNLKTENSNYILNTNGLVDKNGNKISPQNITASYFEFNKSNIKGMEDYLKIDIFDKNGVYNGNRFITYGMPYLVLTGENGEEIFVSKQYPSVITSKITNLKELLSENVINGEFKTITKEDLKLMVELSNKSGNSYPVDSTYAINNKIIMPYKWNLNVERGIWEEVGIKLIDTSGTYETIYYNYN